MERGTRFIFHQLRAHPVVRSAINPPSAFSDEGALMSHAQRSIDEIPHPYVSRIWNRGGKAALAALTNDISTTTAYTPGFILGDIGAILSRAKTVYSANVVFTNARAAKYVTRTYIPLDTCVSWASIRRLTHLLISFGGWMRNFVSFITDTKQIWHKEDYYSLICDILGLRNTFSRE